MPKVWIDLQLGISKPQSAGSSSSQASPSRRARAELAT
jgi:hypothetical protein